MPELPDRSPTAVRPSVDDPIAELYDATAGRVYGVALALLGDRPSAEDVTREVYLAVSRDLLGPGRHRARRTADPVALAHRLAVERLRRRPRGARPGADRPVSRAATAVLARLPDDERATLTQVWFGGRTHAEVDAITGAPAGSSARRLREALARLAPSHP